MLPITTLPIGCRQGVLRVSAGPALVPPSSKSWASFCCFAHRFLQSACRLSQVAHCFIQSAYRLSQFAHCLIQSACQLTQFAHCFIQSAYRLSQFAHCLQAVEADNQCRLDLETSIQQLLGSFAQPIVNQVSQQGATTANSKYDSATYTASQDAFLYDHTKVQLPYTT